MFALPGYRFAEKITSNEEVHIYRLERVKDSEKVIAKTTSELFPESPLIDAFAYEYEQLLECRGIGGLEPIGLEMDGMRPVLLLKDQGGTTLDQLLRSRRMAMKVEDILHVAIALAECMRQLHQSNIILHKMTPLSFWINDDLTEVKVIDLRACSNTGKQSVRSGSISTEDSILYYLSPEQTGRTGMAPDYRSDFYSLGVILYEWFTGSLPFSSRHALDIVHHHLATNPEPVHVKNQAIPEVISDIVQKCMEKMPEARYASAYGIRADLEECLSHFHESGSVPFFAVGSRDISKSAATTDLYYGRVDEQLALQQALRRVSEGATEVVWVSGIAGIGKTSFVLETIRQEVPAEGTFVMSQLWAPETLSYTVWVQVIEQLVDQLLTVNEEQAETWKTKILDAVQGHGRQLTDLVPRLKLLIGEQPELETMPLAEAKNRFLFVLNRFFQLFFEREKPFVVFLDNMHWAEDASIQYIHELTGDGETRNLLIVCSSRDEEWHESLPMQKLRKQLTEQGTRIEQIELTSYSQNEVQHMLRSFFQGLTEEIDELAAMLLYKTGGNPFLLIEFIQELLDQKLICFDESNRTWRWRLSLIAEQNVADQVATALANSLQNSPEQTIYLLGRAAFLGMQFDLSTLSQITHTSIEVLRDWADGVEQNRLLRLENRKRSIYFFEHEDIQQTAYEAVPESERMALHAQIGLLLADRQCVGEAVHLFEVLHHLNLAKEQVIQLGKKMELAIWNLQAGVKAKQSFAMEAAVNYLRLATELLPADSWENNYSTTFQAFRERAEAEFLCSNFTVAQELFELTLERAVTDFDKAQVCLMMIQLELNRDSYREMIALAEKTMKLLGFRYHSTPSSLDVLRLWVRVQWKLRKRPIETMSQLPAMTDERQKAAMRVLAYTSNASFSLDKKAWSYDTLRMMEITLDHGLISEGALGFVGYAMMLNYGPRRYEAAYQWGVQACKVAESRVGLYVQTHTAFSLCYDSWRQHDPSFLHTFSEHVGKAALQSGDLWHANNSLLFNCGLLFQFSHPLQEIYAQLLAYTGKFQQNKTSYHWKQAAVLSKMLTTLMGYRASNDQFEGVDIEEQAFMTEIPENTAPFLHAIVYIYQYITGYLFGDYQKALHALELAIEIEDNSKESSEPSSHYFYHVLVLKEIYDSASKQEKVGYLRKIRQEMKRLKRIADRCPDNYLHKYLLVKAELCRIEQKNHQAEKFFEQAITAARRYGLIHDVGIIAESYASYGMKVGKPMLAKLYINEAYEAYLQWGALAKTADMERKVGHLLNKKRETEVERADYLSVVISAQALSGEMEMGKLLNTLMRIMLQNAGAEYGALLFKNEGWMVEAFGIADKLQIQSIPLYAAEHLVPSSIIEFTARTQQPVILHDGAGNSMFQRDEYIKRKECKSVLCLPISYKNELICLLYVENNLSKGVFTKERLDVLKLLSSQCAISIANAQLFSQMQYLNDNLEQQVAQRTHSLEKSMKATSEALAEMTVYAERNRIAQEIHDIVGHTLTSTILQIEAGKRLLNKDRDSAVGRLKEAQDLVRHSLNEIRNSVHMLKEDRYYDIFQVMEQLVQDTERNTGAVIEAHMDSVEHLSLLHKKVLYHALQEGLTNGIRHGKSNKFQFRLHDDGATVHFSLTDNGVGASNLEMGFGLKMMNDRVQQLKGTLHIDSQANKGCLLRIELPYGVQGRE